MTHTSSHLSPKSKPQEGHLAEGDPIALPPISSLDYIGGTQSLNSSPLAPRPATLLVRRSALVDAEGAVPSDKLGILLEACTGELKTRHWKEFGITASGRSLILPLPEDQWFSRRGTQLTALRAKGVTDHGDVPRTKAYKKSPLTVFRPSSERTEVVDGRLRISPALPQPTGYLLKYDAENEFKIARHVFRIGLPAPYPVALGTFLHSKFKDQDLGFVVFGIPEQDNARVHEVRSYDLAVRTYRDAARLLKRAHDLDIYFWNPHPGNFYLGHSYSVGVCDFEDSKARGVQELTKEECALYACRDMKVFAINLARFHPRLDNGAYHNLFAFFRHTILHGYFANMTPVETAKAHHGLIDIVDDESRLEWRAADLNGETISKVLKTLSSQCQLYRFLIEHHMGTG